MINIRELRIGNKIQGHSGAFFSIQPGDMDYIGMMPEIYRSIPITEEWLLRMGFKDSAGIKVFINGRYDVERVLSDSEEWGFCIDGLEVGATIKYVHQLQNLFYSLTGTELQFSPIEKQPL